MTTIGGTTTVTGTVDGSELIDHLQRVDAARNKSQPIVRSIDVKKSAILNLTPDHVEWLEKERKRENK